MANHFSDLLGAGLEDASGLPLSSGKVYHYAAGTVTLKDLYTDYPGTTPAAQPIILDGAGVAQVYGSGLYKFVIQDSTGALIRTLDNVGLGDTVTAPTRVVPSTDSQVLFTVPTYLPGSNSLRVYLDGVRLSLANGDYTETSTSSITLSSVYANSVKVGYTVLLVEVF